MKPGSKRISYYFLPVFAAVSYLFLYIPIIVLVVFSFNNAKFPSHWVGFTTRWYTELLYDTQVWSAFYNSLIIAVSSVLLSITLAVALVYGASSRLKKLFVLFYGSVLLPEIVLAVGLLSFFSFFSVPLGLTTLIVGHTLLGLGFAVPIIHARFEELEQNLTEASLDLGATPAQTFFKINLPLLFPAVLAAALLVLIISFDDFLISFFCSGSSTQTISLYIFAMIRSGVSPVINALSTIILGISIIIVLMLSLFKTRLTDSLT